MKTPTRLAAALSLVALAATASPAAAQDPPKSGGTLTWGVETEAATLNPHRNGQDKTKLYLRNAFESLLARDETGGYVPWLADAYSVSPDGLVYTFTLRNGVSFTDGRTLDAGAVATNFEKIRDPQYGRSNATGPGSHIATVRAVDDKTVELTLKAPYAPFLDFAAGLEILSPAAFDSDQLTSGGPAIAGTGPFILKEYTKGQQLRFVRNAAYNSAPANAAHQGPAYLDEVVYRFLPESAVRTGALTSGQVDVIEGVSGNDAGLFQDDASYTYIRAYNTGTPYSLFLNNESGPTRDVAVRKAIGAAIDLDAVLRSVYRGQRTRAWGINTPADTEFYDASIEKTYGFDPALANRLLDEAGWTARDGEGFRTKGGERLTIKLVQAQATVRDQRDVLLQALQAQVKQNAGIDLVLEYVDAGTYTDRIKTGDYGTIANSNTPTGAIDVEYHYLPLQEGGSINYGRAAQPELRTWLREAAATNDHETRFDIYSRLQDFAIRDQAIAFPLYVPEDQIAASADVKGIAFRPFKQLPENAHAIWLDR